MARRSCAFQEPQEPRYHLIWLLEALGGIEVLNEADPEFSKSAIPSVILDGTCRRVKGFTVDLQNAPSTITADQEVGLSILS